MCFSAEASFAVGIPLIPAGLYCVRAALHKRPAFLGLAVVPIFFGIQQISEGFVWHALEHGDLAAARAPSLVFLFFALALWPFWFSLATLCTESQVTRRWVLIALVVLTSGWFWVLYYPLLVGPTSMLTIQKVHHSIRYVYDEVPIYQYIPQTPLRLLYFLSVALPPLIGSENWGRVPGLVLGASAVAAAVIFDYAFVSVWCFFAAVLAMYCCYFFYRLPMPGSLTTATSEPAPTVSSA